MRQKKKTPPDHKEWLEELEGVILRQRKQYGKMLMRKSDGGYKQLESFPPELLVKWITTTQQHKHAVLCCAYTLHIWCAGKCPQRIMLVVAHKNNCKFFILNIYMLLYSYTQHTVAIRLQQIFLCWSFNFVRRDRCQSLHRLKSHFHSHYKRILYV